MTVNKHFMEFYAHTFEILIFFGTYVSQFNAMTFFKVQVQYKAYQLHDETAFKRQRSKIINKHFQIVTNAE